MAKIKPELILIIQRLFEIDPTKRPSAIEVINYCREYSKICLNDEIVSLQ